MEKARIFISYSHRGHGPEWKAALLRALTVFEQHHLLDVWQDGRIRVSSYWEDDINEAMASARVAVVLLTPEALGSEFILQKEFPRLRERQRADGLPVFPVVCEECDWRAHDWLQATQAPNESLPLAPLSHDAQDRAFRQLATNIAEELSRVALADLPSGDSPAPDHVCLDRFPMAYASGLREERLIGREQELALLDLAFAQPGTAVVSLVAWGGVGKSMLVQDWLRRLERDGWFGAQRVYGWSFYSQGTTEDRQASEDSFLAHALEWFGVECEPTLSPWDKGRLLADAIGRERTLLILDGIEPLQYPPGPMGGQLRAPGVQSLLKHLARKASDGEERGICLATTREPLADLAGFQRRPNAPWGSVLRVDLGNLIDEAGAALLHHAGATRAGAAEVEPDDAELLAASHEVDGHALTLNLLGRFLSRAHGGDIRRRDLVKFEEADRTAQGGTTFRMLAAFEDWFARSGEFGVRQLAVLRMLGLFDRPADTGCIAALREPPAIAGLTDPLFATRLDASTGQPTAQPQPDEDWNTTTSFLADFGLVSAQLGTDGRQLLLDCHPLIREHFARQVQGMEPDAWCAAHRRLHEHLKGSCEYQPSTLEGLQPLYESVIHGAKAGLYSDAMAVFQLRIHRLNDKYSIHQLGAYGDDLSARRAFFTVPWSAFTPAVNEKDQAYMLNDVAICLRSLGRLQEAVEPLRISFRMNCGHSHLTNAAVVAGNLGEALMLLGDVRSAIVEERLSVELAERTQATVVLATYLTALGDALHQAGHGAEASAAFERALAAHQELHGIPQLIAQGNFRHCEFLLRKAERTAWERWMSPNRTRLIDLDEMDELERACSDAERRARYSLDLAQARGLSLLGPALDELILGRSMLYRSLVLLAGQDAVTARAAAERHLQRAADALRRTGQLDQVPRALITRAWILCHGQGTSALGDALCDLEEAWGISERGPMLLHMCDIHLHRARLLRDRSELKRARLLIEQCGYWRRREELEDAEAEVIRW